MRNTNRFANRLVVFSLGLLVLSVAAIVALVTMPATKSAALEQTARLWEQIQGVVADAGPATVYGLGLAMAVLVLSLSLVLIVPGRGGRTTMLRDVDSILPGAVELSTQFLNDAVNNLLGDRPELLAVQVSAWRDRRRTVLLIAAEPRAGVSPHHVVNAVNEAVAALDTLLGHRLPVVLRISGGARRALASADRVR